MIGEGFVRILSAFIARAILISFALGGLAVWGLPKLWALIKPLIHQATG